MVKTAETMAMVMYRLFGSLLRGIFVTSLLMVKHLLNDMRNGLMGGTFDPPGLPKGTFPPKDFTLPTR